MEKLRRTAAQLPTLHRRDPMYRGNPAITILRISLWLMPALFIPLIGLIGGVLGKYLSTPATISLMFFLMLTATIGTGLFEEALRFQQLRIPLKNAISQWISSTVFFVLLQIIIAPAVVFALAYIYFTIMYK